MTVTGKPPKIDSTTGDQDRLILIGQTEELLLADQQLAEPRKSLLNSEVYTIETPTFSVEAKGFNCQVLYKVSGINDEFYFK